MADILGIHTTSSYVYLAVSDGDVVQDLEPGRLPAPDLTAGSQSLAGFLTEFTNALADLRPCELALLLPESTYKTTYSVLAPRVAAEAIIALAANNARLHLHRVHRQTVRARLGLPKSGKLEDHLQNIDIAAAGPYWKLGRQHAAVAALTIARTRSDAPQR